MIRDPSAAVSSGTGSAHHYRSLLLAGGLWRCGAWDFVAEVSATGATGARFLQVWYGSRHEGGGSQFRAHLCGEIAGVGFWDFHRPVSGVDDPRVDLDAKSFELR
jgi:hypothetical protein